MSEKPDTTPTLTAGLWCHEDGKGTRLYIAAIDRGEVLMSYQPDDPIAVVATIPDFERFFTIES